MSILIPAENFTPDTDGPIRWQRTAGFGWYGQTATGITYTVERGRNGTFWAWVTVNGQSKPLRAFPTSAEAAAHAAEHYTAR